MSSVSSQRSCLTARSARARRVFSSYTAPVGLQGDTMRIRRVRGVMARATASGSTTKLSSGRDTTGTGRGARQLGDLGVAHPVGRREDDLVALVEHSVKGVEDDLLGAGAHHDLAGRDLEAVGLGEPGCHRLAQLGRALHLGVLCRAAIERLLGRFLDVRRRVEVGLSRSEAHHVDALGLELRGLGGDLEGHRRFNDVEPFGESHFPFLVLFANFVLRASTTGAGAMRAMSPPMEATSFTRDEET